MEIRIGLDAAARASMIRPVAVFDAGIGSFAAVAAIRHRLPRQDILYFADRAHFPYGGKRPADLRAIVRDTLRYLDTFAPAAVLVASNAPSVMVLDDVADTIAAPVVGVRPPIRAALTRAGDGDVAVLGVASLIHSAALRDFLARQAGADVARVHPVVASPLVALVESGAFLFDPDGTQDRVGAFLDRLGQAYPAVSCVTLSSTHLPWLRAFIVRARPEWTLLDPLDDAIDAIASHATDGTGTTLALVTEDARLPAADLAAMFERLGVSLPLHVVRP